MGKTGRTVSIVATLLLASSALAAQPPDQQSEVYGDWTVRCVQRENVPPCDMIQVATQNESKEQVLRVSIAHAGVEDKLGVQMIVPLGVLISGGVLVRADGKDIPAELKFTRCETTGCFIEAVLDSDAIKPFRDGQQGIIAVLDREGKPMVMPLSFKGFTAAMDAMSEKNRAWADGRQGK